MARKKYSIDWENDEPISFEVDGITYNALEDVPNEKDREKLSAMLDASFDDAFDDSFEDMQLDEKEFEELQKSSAGMEKILLGIFSGVAVLMLLIAGISSYFAIQKISKEESTPGRIADVVVRKEYINEQDRITRDFYYPVIEFTASDGKKRTVQISEGSDSPYYEKGDEITVLYDPEHPLDARIQSAGSNALMWILPAITGILGIAFTGAVLVVKKLMPPAEE
jgi:succinate dehydrogenase hydrophobic anchor subunit